VLDPLAKEPVVTNASVKERVLEAVQKLPADATFEDVMERLVFLSKIDRGIAEADQGRTLSHEEVKARLAS
jgi:predicted transcriptional regulator